MQQETLPQLRQPQQLRSKASQQRLLDAATSLMKAMVWEDILITDIAKEANLSVGCFYARFTSKDALLLMLHQRYEEQRIAYFEEFFESDIWLKPLAERVSTVVTKVVNLMQEHRGVLRTFLLRFWSKPEEFGGLFGERLDHIYDQAAKLLLRGQSEINHPNPEKAARMAIAVIGASCRDALVLKPAPNPGAVEQTLNSFKRELSEMVLGYLGRGSITKYREKTG